MPNIAAVLKDEIRRLAKKEIKAQVGTAKQAVVEYRSDMGKREALMKLAELEQQATKKGRGRKR
jgi:hypothetical protein